MSVPFTLPRFSGSTLEPTTEPVVIYPEHMYQKEPMAFNALPAVAAAASTTSIQPTRVTPSLKRKNKPAFIAIPAAPTFTPNEQENEDFSPWSFDEEAAPELLWDDENQTIYKRHNSVSSADSPFPLP